MWIIGEEDEDDDEDEMEVEVEVSVESEKWIVMDDEGTFFFF